MSQKLSEIELKNSIEALLFVSGDGLSARDISDGLKEPTRRVKDTLQQLVEDYTHKSGGIQIEYKSGKYRFKTSPSVFTNIQDFLKEKKQETLSKTMLEVLAIVAYKQPITQSEVDDLRGVKSRSLVTSLSYKKLIKSIGQKETPGRPTLYGTTREFLDYFSLKSLKDLPALKELKELNFDELG